MNVKYENKKEIKNIRWLLFGVMLALFASEVLFQAVASFMSEPPHDYIRMAVVEAVAFLLPFFLYGHIVKIQFNAKKVLMLNPISANYIAYAILFGITGQFVIMLLNLPGEYIYQTLFGKKDVLPHDNVSLKMLVLSIVSVGIIPSFLEEFLLRGFVFGVYNKLSTKAAVLFTTFIFVVYHGKPESIPGYVFMGLMAVFVMRRSGSLYAAMIYHLASNITAIIFGMIALKILSVLWLLFAVMVVLFIVFFIRFYIKYRPVKEKKSRRDLKIFWSSVFSLPILLSIVIVVIKYWLLNLR